MKYHITASLVLIALTASASAQQLNRSDAPQQQSAQVASNAGQALPSGFEAKSLLKTGKTRDNEALSYPKSGMPEVTSVIGTIQPGGRTPLHEHPVPVFVYIMEGSVELQTEGGQPVQYKAGDAYIESLNRRHQLHNKGNAAAKLLVVFMGEEGKPTTVTPK